MTRTLLPRALRAGARLVPETCAWRLRREAGRWRVTARHGAGAGRWRPVEIVAERVWLAAGAVHTPALLQRSGWPRTAGSTLRLQTMVRVVASFPDAINEPTQVAAHQVREFAPRWTLGCSISTPPNLAMAMLDHPDRLCAIRSEWPRMAIFYGLVRGGMGRVWALPGLAEPLVTYRLRTQDHRDLAEALAGLSRLLLHAGAEEILPGVGACARIRDADGLRRLPETLAGRRATLLSLHLLGSCATGGRSGSLADSFGRIRCANGLHLADASLLPDAPGVNPQGTIMAFARRNVLAALDDSAPTSTR